MDAGHGVIGSAAALLLAVGCSGKAQMGEPDVPGTSTQSGPESQGPERSFENACGVYVTSAPVGAQILVDGKPAGKAPLTVDDLSVGSHDVTFVYEEGERVTLTVELAEGEYKNVHHAHAPDSSDARMPEPKK